MQAVPYIIQAVVAYAVSYVLAPDGPDIEGPRLTDRAVQTNSYGSPVNLVYGRMLVAGTLVWLENNELKETRHKESSGGKGGGGGSVTTYTYSATCAVAICEGTIAGIGRIWGDAVLLDSSITSSSGLTDQQQARLQQSSSGLSSGFLP